MTLFRKPFALRATAVALLIALVALVASPVGAVPTCTTDCYVSPTGNDANDGATAATPLLTIQLAVTSVNAGGTIHLAAGTFTQDTVINKSLTLDGAGPTMTFIDPTSIGLDISADDVTVSNLAIINASIHGARLQDVAGTVLNATFDTVYFTTNTSRGLEIATNATNVTVTDCVFDGNRTGIRSSSTAVVDGLHVTGSTFKNHTDASSGIGIYQANEGNPGNMRDLTVDNSLFENNGFVGIYGEELRDVVVENSTFQNETRGFLLFDAYAGSATATGPFLFENNTFTDHKTSVIQFQVQANALGFPITVQDNTFTQNAAVAMFNGSQIFAILHESFSHAAVNILNNDITFSGTYGGGATSLFGIRIMGGPDAVEIHDNVVNGGNIGANGGTPATAGLYVVSDRTGLGGLKSTTVLNATGNAFTDFPNGAVIYDEVAAVYGNVPVGAQLHINRNDLSVNSLFGVQSGAGEDTDAVCNWWGAADGPGPVGPGSGSNVSSDVDYDPWLLSADLDSTCVQVDGYIVSSEASGVTDDAVAYGMEDLLQWDPATSTWSKWFDGSDAGLMPSGKNKHNIIGTYIPDPLADTFYMSFGQNARFVTGITGKVNGMDLVKWDGSAFSLYMDGEDVGLRQMTEEKIDAFHFLDASMWPYAGTCTDFILISTQGPGAVPLHSGGTLKFSGEDILGFCLINTGAATTGKWYKFLDGSDEGMPRNSLTGLSASDDGSTIFLTTRGAFAVDSASGGHSMVYAYDTGSMSFSGPYFNATAEGLPTRVDALDVDLP